MVAAFDPSTTSHLRPWLITTLEPICDADPQVLTDYVLALLKHDSPDNEVKNMLVTQLDDFLGEDAPQFVDTLISALRTKSYMPPRSAPRPAPPATRQDNANGGIPIPIDSLIPPSSSRGKKRALDIDEPGRLPPKGPRLSEGSSSRHGPIPLPAIPQPPSGPSRNRVPLNGPPTGPSHGNNISRGGPAPALNGGPINGQHTLGRGTGGNAPNDYRRGAATRGTGGPPPTGPKEICRDYHNQGYCARGELCQFSHGDDPVIPSPMGFIPNSAFSAAPDFSQQQQMMAMQQMMGGAFPMPWMMDMSGGGGYDPTESRMDMSRGMRPIITEAKDVTPSNTLNPNAIPFPPPQPLTDTATQGPAPIPAHIRQFPPRDPPSHTDGPFHAGQRGVYNPGAFKRDGPPHMAPRQGDTTMQDPPPPPQQLRLEPTPLPDKPLWTQPQRHQAANYKASHQDKTLVVEKIPADHLSLGAITTFFQKFGPVSNVAVDNRSYKALVTFEQHNDALAAHRTQEAIFGNRFVRVYWHRPLEGQGAVGQKALAASVDLVKNMANRQPSTPGATAIGLPTSPHPPSTPTKLSKAASALAAKTAFIDDLVTEQKILLKKIDEAKDPNMRKEYFTLLKRIQQQMTNAQTIEIASNKVQSRDQTPGPTLDERQQRVKEKLDKELEMHQVKVEQESSAPKEDAGAEDDPEVLLAKLTSLQQAVNGLDYTDSIPSSSRGGYQPRSGRGIRGRGRGRGFRAPIVGMNMKLDNRPKKLSVGRVADGMEAAVRGYFNINQDVEAIETSPSGELIVAFKTRAAAEQAFGKGTTMVPDVGSIQFSWYSDTRGPTPAKPSTPKASRGPTPEVSVAAAAEETGDWVLLNTEKEDKESPSAVGASVEKEEEHIQHESFDHLDDVEADGGWGGNFDE